MAKEFVTRIKTEIKENKRNSITNKLSKLIKYKYFINRINIKTKTIIIARTMAAMGNIHNVRIVRFLLIVSIATLTIFIYATYSSNGPLTPPSQPHALRSIADNGILQMPQQQPLISTNKSGDSALTAFSNNIDANGLQVNNHLDESQYGVGAGGNSLATLLKLNRKAAVIPGTSDGIGANIVGAAAPAKPPAGNAAKKHQHREPTIDVDAINDEGPDDDELERFGNELMEDGEVQNIDNVLVGSINSSNTSSAQQNNVGGPQEQAKPQSQSQLDQQKQMNEKSVENANNPDKILDTDVMIPTTNLQKFIENADKILKNITGSTAATDKFGKVLARVNVGPVKDSQVDKQPNKVEGNEYINGGGAITDTNNDEALPPSVVMTIKHPNNNEQPQPQPQPQLQQQSADNHALAKIKSPINRSTPINITDHTKGIPTKECYESGHLNDEINFSKVCPGNGKELKLLILISSAPTHGDARLAIRQTWAHYGTRRDVSIAFVLGRTTNQSIYKELSIENFIYGDMIRGAFIDSYSNLTLKTISTLEWVDQHCRQAKFILKTDDDMFINVPKLLQFIDGHAKQKRVIYGRLAKQWKPIRNKKSKYYVSTEQFSQPLFPPFTTGPAYLLTNDIIHSLYERSLQQVYLKLEDVFTTGIVAQQLGIKRVHANEFLNRRIAFNPCNIRKLISVHMVKSNEQFDLWKKLLDKSTKCK